MLHTNKMLVVFADNQDAVEETVSLLPVTHSFGDAISVLEDGSTLRGTYEHDTYAPNRFRARHRSHLFLTSIHHMGGYGPFVRKRASECPVIVCMTCAHDWAVYDPDLFKACDIDIKLGSRPFNVVEYARRVIKDFSIALQGIQMMRNGQRVWLKIAPIAMGPSIQTDDGQYVAPVASFWYSHAVATVLGRMVNADWVHTLEIVDFTGVLWPLQQMLQVPNVRTFFPSVRDILDFRGCPGAVLPAVMIPVDTFSAPWKRSETLFDSLAVCVANNTNIVQQRDTEIVFKKLSP